MSDFLSSIKADLLDRRLLPLVVVVVLALVGAVSYAVLNGGSGAATPASAVSPAPAAASSGVAISQVTPEKAVAETTGGVSLQRGGKARNPFAPLAGAKAQAASTSAKTTSTSSSSAGSGTGSSSASTESGSGAPSKPSTPAKPKTIYHVAALFGVVPAGETAQTAQLTPYENLKLLAPLPSAKQPLIVFRGVTAGGKSATFTLVSEAILHGGAACLPNATQCEAIDLQAGRSEQLEYVGSNGLPVLYELRIVSIVSSEASSAAVKNIVGEESRAGLAVLSHAGLVAVPDLRYSARAGVLVFGGHPAFAVHSAARRRHGR